jgi:hypothetical protein
MSRNSALPVLLCAGLLSGCADYLNRYDTVTLAAGDAQKHNAMLQTKDPFNPASNDTAITTDGERASDAVVHKYKRVMLPGAAPTPNVTVSIGDSITE